MDEDLANKSESSGDKAGPGMGRLKRRLLVYGVLSLAMMAGIFAFSSMNGQVSTSQSNGIAFWIASRVVEDFDSMDAQDQLVAIHGMTYPIRKAAHMAEYAVLGGLLMATFWQLVQLRSLKRDAQRVTRGMLMRAWTLGFACAVVYACTDEFHQTFTVGRTGQPIDVCIDALGIAIGSLAVTLLIAKRRGK